MVSPFIMGQPLRNLCLQEGEEQKKRSLPKIRWVFRAKVTKEQKNKRSSLEIEWVFGPNEDRDHIK